MLTRGAKISLIVLAGLGVVAIGVVALLSNQAATTRLGHYALERLDAQIPADVRFDSLSIDPARGHIAVDGLAVTAPGKPDEKFLAARQVILDVNMAALLTGKVNLQRLHLVNPEATIIHRGDNRYNFEEVLPPKEEPQQEGPSFFSLDRVTFEGGRVTYLDDPRDAEAELPNLKGSLNLDLPKQAAGGQVTFSGGWARYEGFKQPIESFLARFDSDGQDLTIDALKVDAGDTGLALSGYVRGLSGGEAKLDLAGTLKTKLAQWAPLAEMPLAGTASADFQVQGTTQEPRLAARVSGNALKARDITVAHLESRLTADRRAVRIESLDARLWGGRLEAAGTVPIDEAGRLNLMATVESLDLAAIARQLDIEPLRGATGTVSAHVQAQGPSLEPEAVSATGWVRTDGSFPAEGAQVAVAGRTDFAWRDSVLRLSDLDVKALGGRLTGRAQVAPLAAVPTYGVDATVSGVNLAAVEPFLDEPLPLTGTVDGRISLAGRGFEEPQLSGSANVQATGALKAGEAGNKEALPIDAAARLAFDGNLIRLVEAHARALGGRLEATGTIGLGGAEPAIALEARASGIDLAALDRAFALVEGPLTGQAEGRVRYRGEQLTVEQVTVRTLGGAIRASGSVELAGAEPSYDLDVVATGLDLAAVDRTLDAVKLPMTGQASARFDVVGTGSRFRASGPIEVKGTASVPTGVAGARQAMPLNLAGTVAVTPQSVQLSPLVASLGESRLTARGNIDMAGSSNLTFDGRIVNAPAIARLFGVEGLTGGDLTLAGRAQGTAGRLTFTAQAQAGETAIEDRFTLGAARFNVSGTLDGRLRVTGALEADQLAVAEQRFAELRSPFVYEAPRSAPGQGVLELPAIVARLEQGRVEGKARLDLATERYRVDLASAGLRLADLGAIEQAEGVPLDTPVSLAVTGEGTFADPRLTARVDLAPFTYQGQALGATQLEAEIVDGALRLDGTIFDQQFKVAGTVPTAPGKPVDVTLTFRRAELGPVFAMVPEELLSDVELPIDGLVTGQVRITGPVDRLEALEAEVDLQTLRLAYSDLMLENAGPIQLAYADRRLTIEQFHLKGPDTDLTARGVIGLGAPSNLAIDGKVNLGLLEKAAPKLFAEAAGAAVLEAQLSGTLGSPDLTGALTVRDGALQSRTLPQAITNLNGTVRLVEDRVFLDGLSANLGYTGQVQAVGGATLGPDFMPTQVSVQLTAKEIEVKTPDVSALANAEISFSGTPDNSRLDGEIRLLEGSVTRDVELASQLLERGPGGPAGPPAWADAPFLRNLALRLQVLVPDQFFIRNNVANAELRGDFVVLGTLARPVPVGRAEVLAGTVTFQDVTYTLEEASVDFIDPHRLTPYLHVLANTHVAGFDVMVRANGTPEQLQLDLTSSPFLPQSDVLVLLATGQAPGQDEGGEGLAVAGNFLLGQVAKGVERGVAGGGVVDVLRIQPGSVSPTEVGGGSFTVGKRLSDRLMVTYTQDITAAPGEVPGRIVIFDYLLTPEIVVKLEQNLGGGFNASARYRFTLR